MAQLALGIVGAVIGFYLGGPAGASLGFALGSGIGAALSPKGTIEGPKLNDLRLQSASYGQFIPWVYGIKRIAGNVIWQTDLVPHENSSGDGKKDPEVVTTTYTVSFQILLCKGPITGIKKIWRNGRVAWQNGITVGSDTPLPFVLYLGTAEQLPDPTIEADKGVGNVPGHRGWAHIVFTDLDTGPDGNAMANWEFEVVGFGSTEPFELRRYSTFDVDPNINGSGITYSYPYTLNGQFLNSSGNLVSSVIHADNNYQISDDHDGSISYSEIVRTLRGGILSNTGSSVPPFPQYGSTQGPGLPSITSLQILGSMNSRYAFVQGQVVELWPDGTEISKMHPPDGWMSGGSVVNIPEEGLLALQPDSEGLHPYMGVGQIQGTLWHGNGALYATGSGITPSDNPNTFVRKYGIANGKPSRGFARQYLFDSLAPHPTSGGDITVDDEGNVWVLTTRTGITEVQLYKFDKDLNVLRIWDSPTNPNAMPCIVFDSVGGDGVLVGDSSFAIYRGYIVVNQYRSGDGRFAACCYKLNDDDSTTFVNKVDLCVGTPSNGATPIIYLGQGFMAVTDGILNFGGAGSGAITLGEIVKDICLNCNLSEDEIDVTEIPDPVRGFAITNQSSGRSNIEALIPGFIFSGVESDLAIKWRHLNRPSAIEIPDDELGVHMLDEDSPPLLKTTRAQEVDLLRRIFVRYNDVDADYQDGVQIWEKQTTESQLESTLSLAICMNKDEAKRAADINGFNSWMERERFEFSTARKYINIEPLDVVTVQGRDMRIISKEETRGGVIKWTAVATAEGLFVSGNDGNDGGFIPPEPVTGQLTDLLLLDIPLPTDDSLPYGVPAPMAGGEREDWRGAAIYKSTDGGATYQATGTTGRTRDVMGLTTTRLGDWTGGNIFDECNVATVEIGAGGGTLMSASRTAVLNGANLALIGNEIILFRNATLIDTDTYTLSGLIRGERGTEWAMSSHSVGERFVMLPTQNNLAFTRSDIQQTRSYKAVTLSGSVANAEAVEFTSTGIAARPYAPVHLDGGPNGSGDVTLVWVRRDRKGPGWRDLVDTPMSEATESYIIQIWDSSYTVCARIITVSAAQTTTYTSAQQMTDFGAQQQTIYWTVGQLGSVSLGVQARGASTGAGGSNVNPLTPIAPYGFPTPVAPIPTPSGTVNHTFTGTEYVVVDPLRSGERWCGKFHTSGADPRGSFVAGISSAPVSGRHFWMATDSAGLNKIAGTDRYNSGAPGATPLILIGSANGGPVLAAATDYFFLIDFVQADGALYLPAGTNAPTSAIFSIV